MKLIVKYSKDSVTIIEVDNGKKYEVVRWLEEEIEESVNLRYKVDYDVIKLAKEELEELIHLIHVIYINGLKKKKIERI